MKKKTKSSAIKIHSRRRFQERLGFTPTQKDYAEMLHKIQNGQTIGIKSTNRTTVHEMEYKDKIFDVVYDKQRKLIVTVLLKEEYENTLAN